MSLLYNEKKIQTAKQEDQEFQKKKRAIINQFFLSICFFCFPKKNTGEKNKEITFAGRKNMFFFAIRKTLHTQKGKDFCRVKLYIRFHSSFFGQIGKFERNRIKL